MERKLQQMMGLWMMIILKKLLLMEMCISLESESDAAGDGEDALNHLALETREITESPFYAQEMVVAETGNIELINY